MGSEFGKKKYTELRFPLLMDLRGDPFERAQHASEGYSKWLADRMFMMVPAQAKIAEFLSTFKEYPQRQKVGSFSLDQVLEQMQTSKRN